MNLKSLLSAGIDAQIAEADEKETHKSGVLRGGSVGLFDKDAQIFSGKCPRQTYLRYKGVDYEDKSPHQRRSTQLMFDNGFANEDLWMNVLQKVWKGKILREEEFPIEWRTNGVKGTGREDIILCDEQGKPVRLLELKQIVAIWKARDILTGTPPLDQLTQASNYALRTGIPVSMLYTWRVHGAIVGDWMVKLFPTEDQEGSQHIEYAKGKPKKVLPFFKVFDLNFHEDGFIRCVDQDTMRETKTIINLKRIDDYYEHVVNMDSSNELGPRPQTLLLNGQKGGFLPCDYCPLRATCDEHETKGVKEWTERVVQASEAGLLINNEALIKKETQEKETKNETTRNVQEVIRKQSFTRSSSAVSEERKVAPSKITFSKIKRK